MDNDQTASLVAKIVIKALEDQEQMEKWHKPWIPVKDSPLNWNNKRYNPLNNFLLSLEQMNECYSGVNWLTARKGTAIGGILNEEKVPTSIFTWITSWIGKDKNGHVKWFNKKPASGGKRAFVLKQIPMYNVDQFYWPKDKFPEEFDHVNYNNPEIEGSEAVRVIKEYTDPYLEQHAIKVVHEGGEAFYRKTNDSITMPPMESFEEPEGYAATYIHEAIHSTGHSTRLKRFKDYSLEAYSLEELVAELSSATILHKLNIKSVENNENSIIYLRGWAKHLKENERMITHADARSKKAIKYIEESQPKEPKEKLEEVLQPLKWAFKGEDMRNDK